MEQLLIALVRAASVGWDEGVLLSTSTLRCPSQQYVHLELYIRLKHVQGVMENEPGGTFPLETSLLLSLAGENGSASQQRWELGLSCLPLPAWSLWLISGKDVSSICATSSL